MSDRPASSAVRLKSVEPQRVLVVRTLTSRAALGTALQSSFEAVWAFLNQQESATVGPAIAIYDRVDDEMIEVLAGFPVREPIEPHGRIEAAHLPGGHAATLLHWGDYGGLVAAHETIDDWMAAEKRSAASSRYEIYWVDPTQTEKPEEWRTEVVVPLA